jgi:TonB family protein
MARHSALTCVLLLAACEARTPESQTPIVASPAPTVSVATVRSGPVPKLGPCAGIPKEECGRWEMPAPEKWRAAMSGYQSGIVLAQQQPLRPVAVPLATYVNGMHSRLHIWFADHFLTWLDKQSIDDPMNNPKLVTAVEIGVAPNGQIAKMGVVQPSGVQGFDMAALESFAKAAPFGETPGQARSADGNLWVVWTLRRDEIYACSTQGARPFVFR